MSEIEIAASAAVIVAGVAAIFAVIWARSSAKTAKLAHEVSQTQERDNLISNVLDLATQVMHSSVATATLLHDTKLEMDSVFIANGRANGGIHTQLTKEMARHHSALGEHEQVARAIVESPEILGDLENVELQAKLVILRGLQTAVLRLKEKFERDYKSYSDQRRAN
ncbi:MAG: hypothetical protein ACR2PS_01340 [Pseudomonadales bacterium]